MKVRLIKLMDATAGAFLCWLGGWVLHLSRPRPVDPGRPIRRILVIRPGGMGDMILLQPLLNSLKHHYPAAALDLVCESRNQGIAALGGCGVETFAYDTEPLRTLVALVQRRYDVAVDTEQFHNFSAVMSWISGAPLRIGFKINPGRNPIYTHLVNYDLEGYEAGEFMRLLHPLGICEQAVVSGALMAYAKPRPAEGSGGVAVLIHVGASTRYKRWSVENYAGLINRILADAALALPGDAVIGLVGGPGDVACAREIAGLVDQATRVAVLAGDVPFARTADRIGRARIFIGGDSGLAHLAVALGTPTVVMFGPSDPRKWGVTGPSNAIVRKAMACSPCFIFGYHKRCHSIACMAGITVDEVMREVSRLLASGT